MALRAFLEMKDLAENRDMREAKVPQDQRAMTQLDQLVNKEHRARQDLSDQLERKDLSELRGRLVIKDQSLCRVSQALLVQLARRELPELLALKDLREQMVWPVIMDQLALLDGM